MDKPLRTVLLGTSFSEESDFVLEAGTAFARALGAEIHVVHAFIPVPAYTLLPPEYRGGEAEQMESERQSLTRRFNAQVERVHLGETKIFRYLRPGTPHRVLTEMAEELSADLIVVGTHEHDGRSRVPVIGSTADRVLRKARCPVLVVRPGAPWPPEKALVPVDLSPASQASMRLGLTLLEQAHWNPKETEVLFVLSPFERQGSLHFTPEQIDRFAAEELDRVVAGTLVGPAGTVRTRVRTGDPGEQILAEVGRSGADLVILGTHGRSGFERLLIGSVAAEVVREAPTSILVVPPEMAAGELAEHAERLRNGADWYHVSDEVTPPS